MHQALMLKIESFDALQKNYSMKGVDALLKRLADPDLFVNDFMGGFNLTCAVGNLENYAEQLETETGRAWLAGEDFGGEWESHPVPSEDVKHEFDLKALAEAWNFWIDYQSIQLYSTYFDEGSWEWEQETLFPEVYLKAPIATQVENWSETDRFSYCYEIQARLPRFMYHWLDYYRQCLDSQKFISLFPLDQIPLFSVQAKADGVFIEKLLMKSIVDHYDTLLSLEKDFKRIHGKN